MLHIKEAIIVEGKFDKERLKSVTDALVIETNGFAIYTDKRLMDSIKKFAVTCGIIILTDSDRAGFSIRNYIKNCVALSGGVVKHAYIPAWEGKERRKQTASKEGILGVEGMDKETLTEILLKVSDVSGEQKIRGEITKQMFFEDGLTGGRDSMRKRAALIKELGLPPRLSTNAFLDIINKICTIDEYKKMISDIR